MADEKLTFILEAKDLVSGTTRKVRGELSGMAGVTQHVREQFTLANVSGSILADGFEMLAGQIGQAIGQAVQFQTDMLDVNSISKLSADAFKQQSEGVLDLSTQLPQSADTLAKGLYNIASSGFQGADGMKVLDASARAASAGLSTTEASSTGLTAVLNAYHLSADEASRVSDVMFKTVDRGVVTFDQLAGEVGKTTALAAPLGVSFEQVSAAISLMTRNGIDAANATTQINAIMTALLKPTKQAKDLANELGLSWDADTLKSRGLTGVLSDMQAATHGNASDMAVLLGSSRAIRGAMVLAADGGSKFNDELKLMQDSSGATADALSYQKQGAAYQAQILGNKIQALVTTIVDDALPALNGLLDVLGFIAGAADTVTKSVDHATGNIFTFAHDAGEAVAGSGFIEGLRKWRQETADNWTGVKDIVDHGVHQINAGIENIVPPDNVNNLFGEMPGRIRAQTAAIASAINVTLRDPVAQAAHEARATAMSEFKKLPKDIGDAIENGLPTLQTGLDDLKDLIKNSLSDNEKEAKLRGILTSKALAKGLHDERFDVRAAARDLQQSTRQELRELTSGAKDAAADGAKAYARFLRAGRQAAENAGKDVAVAAGNGLRLNAYTAGTTVTKTYIDGIVDELIKQIPTVNNAAYRFMQGTFGTSLPKSGPMSGPKLSSAAKSIAQHYAAELGRSFLHEQGSVQRAMTLPGGAGMSAPAGGAGHLTVVFQSQLPPSPSQGQELARRIGPELVRWMRQNGG